MSLLTLYSKWLVKVISIPLIRPDIILERDFLFVKKIMEKHTGLIVRRKEIQATVMDSYIKKGCQIDGVSIQATVMNSYMRIKKMICSDDVKIYRLQLVQYARKYGIKPAAKEFGTTPKTVRKWVKRYQEDKELGMKDLPRPKLNCPHRIDPETEQRIIEFRKAHMRWGARTIKEALELDYSQVAIHRVIKQAGLILPKRTKSKKRKDMTEARAKVKAFSRFQVDIKYLTDIPEYEFWRWEHNFPKYLIVARDYKTGASFCAYSHEKTPVATGLFMDLVLHALKRYGIRLETLTIQTDNCSEFTNPTS